MSLDDEDVEKETMRMELFLYEKISRQKMRVSMFSRLEGTPNKLDCLQIGIEPRSQYQQAEYS